MKVYNFSYQMDLVDARLRLEISWIHFNCDSKNKAFRKCLSHFKILHAGKQLRFKRHKYNGNTTIAMQSGAISLCASQGYKNRI